MTTETTIEKAKAVIEEMRELLAKLEAERAAPRRNWPEKVEAGMQVADCMISGIHPYSFRSGEWARLAGVAMVTPKNAEPRLAYAAIFDDGTVDYIAASDSRNYEIKARDILTIRTDAHEPTGAELVGEVCEFSDDGKEWHFTDGRECNGYSESEGYSWGMQGRWWQYARPVSRAR